MKPSLHSMVWDILTQNLTAAESEWLSERRSLPAMELMTAFVATPRFVAKRKVNIEAQQLLKMQGLHAGFSVKDWEMSRLARVWLLGCLDASKRDEFVHHIETLFDTAEMNELVALYSALPALAYPDHWVFRATDAVRSNMGIVFDAIALNNPYPAVNFTEQAWNQMVLKTIFNDKPLHFIHGLTERANEKLAVTLSDFAHERWAAGRQVAPQVWRLVIPFMQASLMNDMEHLFQSDTPFDREAAALVCHHTDYAPAKALGSQYSEFEARIQTGSLSWTHLEFLDLNTYHVSKP